MKLKRSAMLRAWPALMALVSFFMLAAAHAFERFGGLPPCELCLRQREVYWVAFSLGLAVLIMRKFFRHTSFARGSTVLLGLVFLTGCLIAGYHAGVEWHIWPGPASCTGTVEDIGALADDLLSALSKPNDIPMCDEIPWSLMGISMAGWNALVSLALAIVSFWLIWPGRAESVEL